MRERAAASGRQPRFAVRVDVLARDTHEEAWAEARRGFEAADPDRGRGRGRGPAATPSARPRQHGLGGTSTPQRAEDLLVAPNTWAGFHLLRPGPVLGLVGDHETVAERLDELVALGVDSFILAGVPHLEEAYRVGEEVLPLLGRATATAALHRAHPVAVRDRLTHPRSRPMTTLESPAPTDLAPFVEGVVATATEAFARLRATGALTPSATIQINERVPGHDAAGRHQPPEPVADPHARRSRPPSHASTATRWPATRPPPAGARRFAAVFEQHPDVTTVVHVHSPYVGAWAQVHRALPVVDAAAAGPRPGRRDPRLHRPPPGRGRLHPRPDRPRPGHPRHRRGQRRRDRLGPAPASPTRSS